jgi:hypothetical protein
MIPVRVLHWGCGDGERRSGRWGTGGDELILQVQQQKEAGTENLEQKIWGTENMEQKIWGTENLGNRNPC